MWMATGIRTCGCPCFLPMLKSRDIHKGIQMKDSAKYRYVNVGLGWGSWALEQLLQDAEMHQMADQPAKLAALRLTEYYRLVERGIIVPGMSVLVKGEDTRQAEKIAPMEAQATSTRRTTTPPSPIALEESASVGANANAALLAFMDDDE